MAGVPAGSAGTLSIQLVAQIAQLQADLDKAKRLVNTASADIGRNARAANDNLAGIGKGAGSGMQQFARDVAQLKAQLDPAWAAQQRFNDQQRLAMTALRQGAIDRQQFITHMRQINAELKGATNPMEQVTASAGAQRAGMQQLGFQLQDFAVQVAGGTSATRAFAQQFPQAVGAMTLMTGETSKLGRFLGGPWGIALAVAAAALVPLIDKLFETKDALDDVGDSAQSAMAKLAQSLSQTSLVSDTMTENATKFANASAAVAQTTRQISELQQSISAMEGKPFLGEQVTALHQRLGQLEQRRDAAKAELAAVQADVVRLRDITNNVIPIQTRNEEILHATEEKSRKARKAGLSDAQKAYKQADEAANQFIQSLQNEIDRIGKSEKQIRALDVAKAIDAAATDAQRMAIAELANERERLLEIEEKARAAKAVEDENKSIGEDIAKLKDELQLIPLVGAERERLAAALDLENRVRAIGVKIAEAEKAGNTDLITQLQAQIILLHKKHAAEMDTISLKETLDREADAAYALNEQLRDTISLLGDLGKVGEGLGALLGILTGNTRGVRGPIGDLLNVGMTGRNDEGKKIASTIGDEISKIFDKDGKFVKAVLPMLQNAATGMAAGSLLFGRQSATEQAGSAIGGALGGKLGEKALSKGLEDIAKGLGDFAGPLGSIVGGVLGNVLGGVFGKVKWGRVDLTSAGVSDTSGNSKSSQKAALAAGNSIYGGLADLARQFGGRLGDFGRISVGVRHGDYRVNTGGTSLKVKKGAVDFNEDAEAAVAYAMKMAIERGAINGIRQSTNNLLKAGDDLSAQINKALSFENVFSELKSYLDPVGYELENLEKEFASLRAIFAEAGATAQEYAQLEQLLTIKRQEALNKEQDALNDIRSRIAEVQGDDATVKAIARARELREATSDAQRAELERLYALEDAAEAQSAAALAAEELRQAWESVGSSIMDEVNRIRGLAGGDDAASFATLQGRFNAAVAAARSGDQEAAARLVDLSQSLLEAAGNAATSRQELERIKAQTAASLEGVHGLIDTLGSGSASASAASASSAAAAGSANGGSSSADSAAAAEIRSLREELAKLRAEMNSGNATIAGNTGRIARKLDDVTAANGGEAISVAGAA